MQNIIVRKGHIQEMQAVLPRQMNGSGALTEEKLVYALLSLFGLLAITCAYNKKAERAEEILDISYLPGLKIDST